jgi:hypothetical protein
MQQNVYNVRAEKEDYTTKKKLTITDETEKKFRYRLRKRQCKVTVGDDLNKCFGIKMIY